MWTHHRRGLVYDRIFCPTFVFVYILYIYLHLNDMNDNGKHCSSPDCHAYYDDCYCISLPHQWRHCPTRAMVVIYFVAPPPLEIKPWCRPTFQDVTGDC
jgi:hypothetical protein